MVFFAFAFAFICKYTISNEINLSYIQKRHLWIWIWLPAMVNGCKTCLTSKLMLIIDILTHSNVNRWRIDSILWLVPVVNTSICVYPHVYMCVFYIPFIFALDASMLWHLLLSQICLHLFYLLFVFFFFFHYLLLFFSCIRCPVYFLFTLSPGPRSPFLSSRHHLVPFRGILTSFPFSKLRFHMLAFGATLFSRCFVSRFYLSWLSLNSNNNNNKMKK